VDQVALQIIWELADVLVPGFISATALKRLENVLEDQIQFHAWVLVVNYGRAEVGEVTDDGVRVPGDRVAQPLVGLELLVVVRVSLQVPETDTPLLGYFIERLSHSLWIYQTKSAKSNCNVLGQRFINLFT